MNRMILTAAALALTGCGTTPTQVVGRSERTVMIQASQMEDDQTVLNMASAECRRQGTGAPVPLTTTVRRNPGVFLPWNVHSFECR